MATKDPKPAEHEPESAEETTKSSKKRKSAAIKEIEVDLNLPEPPSKKAKRALKKGKTLPAKPKSSDDEADSDTEKKPGEAKSSTKKKERSPYGVWIGNLRFNVTKAELRKWLVDNAGGAITNDLITRVHMPVTKPAPGGGGPKPKAPTENRGFAYVDFATFEANVAAIALSETELAGRKLLIKDSNNYEGRPKKEATEETADGGEGGRGAAAADQAPPKKNPSTKVFVGNLSFQVTEDDLRAHFEKCGKIRWIKVATFEDSGKCKGYGWVNFEEPEAADWAVKGFVKVRETIDTLEDFMDQGVDEQQQPEKTNDNDGDATAAADDGEETTNNKKKKAKNEDIVEPRIKTRKWWVNQLFGRPLKIELAEDDQTRYVKRFRGKGGQQRQQQADGTTTTGGERKEWEKRSEKKKDINYATNILEARLTGAPVAHQGKKTTFD
ncbi:nucleolar protein 13 [Echria macrotheca]|uniref:Nucleolar protein 13 n=1 Tax=Echria macrotheca TaxID=438768 RepID=A0AAJ0BLU5_9PEZI|nr:nucleolar protein 13 [Echria macrotheca]